MYRSLLVVFVAVPVVAAPVPKDKPVLYYTTKEGTKLVYELKTNASTSEFTETVTKVEIKNGVYRVSISREFIKGEPTISVVEVCGGGIPQEESEHLKWIPGSWRRMPLRPDTSKEFALPSLTTGKLIKLKHKIGTLEEIEVPAGKFKAISVEIGVKSADLATSITHWYAPGIGIVKSVTKTNDFEQIQVLKSFTEGK